MQGPYITLCSQDFPDDTHQVAFILCWPDLKGSTLDWFQNAVTHSSSSFMSTAWLISTPIFLDKLHRLFSPHNPVKDATVRIENLRYKDSGKAIKYTLNFNWDTPRTSWNDKALYQQFYKGLLDWLKDKLTRIGKPETLIPLQHQVQILDQRYWKCQAEISHDKHASSNTAPAWSDKPKQLFSENGSNCPVAFSSQAPAQMKAFSSSSKLKNPNTDKLSKNDKLTPEKQDHCFKLQLYLFCSKPGHKVTDCPNAKNSAKGKASTTEPANVRVVISYWRTLRPQYSIWPIYRGSRQVHVWFEKVLLI